MLSCNKCSHGRVTQTQDTTAWGYCVWLVMAFIRANGTRIATPRSMPNRCQSMSTIKGSTTSRRLSVTAGSGGKRHRNAATPREEKITRHGCVWRAVLSAVASHWRISLRVSRWSRHYCLQVVLLQCGCLFNLEVSCDCRCRITSHCHLQLM